MPTGNDIINTDLTKVYEAMLRTTNAYIKMVKCKTKVYTLRTLRKRKIGTNCVENLTRKLCSHPEKEFKLSARVKIIQIVMTEKLGDAYQWYKQRRFESNKIWREAKKIICGETRDNFRIVWRRYVSQVVEKLENNAEKKIEWLTSKWKQKEIIPDMYEGVVIKTDNIPVYDNSPRIYGGVEVTEDEKAALLLPPKFAIYEEINITECRIRVEESLNKLRWNKLIGGKKEKEKEKQFFDLESKCMNINNLRATTLPFNPSVSMPGPVIQQDEVKMTKFRSEVMQAARECRKQGERYSNMTETERNGLESLREKVKEGEMICCVTDKSGRWACDTRQSYKQVCMDELNDVNRTPVIDEKEHNRGERELNSHAAALLRMMGLEEEAGSEGERLRRAVQAQGTGMAPFYGLRKDHKVVNDVEKGPRVRPLCGAKECSTRRSSFLLCQLLSPLIAQGNTQCQSTDELLSKFERVNREKDADPRWIIGSLDVVSLYPSLDIDVCTVVVALALIESDIQFEKLRWSEIGLYLRYNMSLEELENEGLEEWCPKRRHDRKAPMFECSGSALDRDVRYEPWIFPDAAPDNDIVRRMFGIAIGVMVKKVMRLHDFVIDGQIHRQKEGGSIGLDLTGVVADIVMERWDKMLLRRLINADIEAVVYGRYKDDVNFVVEARGQEEGTECGEERDRRVMERIQVIADSVLECIKVEVDCGYNHPEKQGRVPVLDVEVWIGKGGDGRLKIMHSHYVKDVANRLVMLSRSAHGETTKRNVMVNEICRILKNCSLYLPWQDIAVKVSDFVRRMEASGYEAEFRYKVVRIAIRRYRRKLKKWHDGGEMYADDRTPKEIAADRGRKRENWYKGDGKYESVLFVQPTVKSKLKKEVQMIARRNDVKVKVIEKAGLTVKHVLQKSNPYPKKRCERVDCAMCEFGRFGECRTRGCGYKIMCKEDGKEYRGQTGRSVYERLREEMRALQKKDEKCQLWRHAEGLHQGQWFDMEVKVTDKCFGKPSRRMIAEAVRIEELDADEAMNGKHEWTYIGLDKVHIR